jgi:methionyl aminopeptidase
MIERNDPCWCGSGKKWKKCHYPEGSQDTAPTDIVESYRKKHQILIKNPAQIAGIREACRLAAQILDATCARAVAGNTTLALNDFAHQLHRQAKAIPAPLNYGSPPFPKSICTSLNEVICHGIPDATPLEEGDILNIDVTCILNGFFGDCSRMVLVSPVSEEKQRVVNAAYDGLMAAIAVLKPGLPLNQIGAAIEAVAQARGCSVVHQFVGHGVGIKFHEGPQVPHYRNANTLPLVPGMTFTIEPMINAGVPTAIIDATDHWTARTADGRPSAQWEHTVLITETGYEILTPWHR